jgi:hypothetical protein
VSHNGIVNQPDRDQLMTNGAGYEA